MRGFIIFLIVAGGLVWAGKAVMKNSDFSLSTLVSGGPEKAAESRVHQILEGLKTDGDARTIRLQASICQWYSAVNAIQDRGTFEVAYDGFDAWRRDFGIADRKISDYEITGVELIQPKPPVALVSGTIEHRPFKMQVPDRSPISWVK